MPREFGSKPKLHSVTGLRADVDKLFSSKYGTSSELKWWNGILLGKSTEDVVELKHVPAEAMEILAGVSHRSIESATLAAIRQRQTESRHLFGQTAVTYDLLICSLDSYIENPRDHRKKHEQIFYYSADMTQPSIPYDERFAGFVSVCLEKMQENI